MIILDTDHFSVYPFTQTPAPQLLRSRLEASDDPTITKTIVTFEEQMRGWMARINREHDPLQQVSLYARLMRLADLLRAWPIIPYDERSAAEFVRLRRQHRRIGSQDLKIASIAIANGALLLSANLRDFQQISGLRVENWLAIPQSAREE